MLETSEYPWPWLGGDAGGIEGDGRVGEAGGGEGESGRNHWTGDCRNVCEYGGSGGVL